VNAGTRAGAVRGRRARDTGMSLAELIVAIGIFGIIIVALGSTAVVAIRTVGNVTTRVDNATQGELGLASATKVLRTAVLPRQLDDYECSGCTSAAIVKATSTEVAFYANLGRSALGPSLVTLQVLEDPNRSGTAILEQRTQDPLATGDGRYTFCNASLTSCVVQKRILSRTLVWPVAGVFSYFDLDGKALSGTALTAAQVSRVSSIDVVLAAQSRPGQNRWRPLTALSRVRLPNVEIDINSQEITP
jgi:type II secretory pathway pseudopilin PulG